MIDRFISPGTRPTARQREILELLAEECAEVIQRCTKALRFGLNEVQPGQPLTNAQRIGFELGDLKAVVNMALKETVVDNGSIYAGALHKRSQLARYMQTEPDDLPVRNERPHNLDGERSEPFDGTGTAGSHE